MTPSYTPGQKLRAVNSKVVYQLGEFIAAGGEGSVYALSGQSDRVAKLYPAAMTKDRVKRLSATINAGTSDIKSVATWPEDILVTRHRAPVGFVMPRVDNAAPLHQLISPVTRLKERPNFSYGSLLALAENLCRAVATLHRDNIVIGDINGNNFFVLPNGTVRVIDCDSMQVGLKPKWFPEVKVEEYLPPELQDKHLSKTRRTPSHDIFSLAVMIFQLLIMGRHPFAGNDGLDLLQSIGQRRHAFCKIPPLHNAFKQLGLAPRSILTAEVMELFLQTFSHTEGRVWRKGPGRPSAEAWMHALSDARRSLQTCSKSTAHQFTPQAKACPWCEMEQRGVPAFFAKLSPGQTPAAQTKAKKRPESSWKPYLRVALWIGNALVLVVQLVCIVIYETVVTVLELLEPVWQVLRQGPSKTIAIISTLIDNFISWAVAWTLRLTKIAFSLWLLFVVIKLLAGNI